MNKLLVIEDNKMILNIITKTLEREGMQVTKCTSGSNAKSLLMTNEYDLVITDLNMPLVSGFEIIEYVRASISKSLPIMVVSGANEDKDVIRAIVSGADDYVTKPLSMAQLIIRTKKLLGLPLVVDYNLAQNSSVINKKRVGVVIPCYNEAARLLTDEFSKFVNDNTSYTICFVNDGSTDNTLELLEKFKAENPEYIQVVNCDVNGGKSEAVRQGMLYLYHQAEYDHIGFLDADLSTDFNDFESMISLLDNEKYLAVVGSRIPRVGANINRDSTRALISIFVNKLIQSITKMPFQDTQCGAKLFDANIIEPIFSRRFLSRWLFDVEIFLRMKSYYGRDESVKHICEFPLSSWIHMDGSKLGFKDSLNIFNELFRINKHYRNYKSRIPSAKILKTHHTHLSQI